MSDWKTKSLEIIRKGNPAPYYERTFAPIPPRKKDCVGERCPYTESRDCYPTRHHLFFEHAAYLALGEPYNKLVNDPHAIVSIARCRHNSTYPTAWHNLYKYTLLPKEEVAARWVEESELLQRLGVLIKDMSSQINEIFDERPKNQWRIFGDGTYEERLERFESNAGEYTNTVGELGVIEVIPSTIVGNVVTNLGERRNRLRELAAEVPELAKVRIAQLPGLVNATGNSQISAQDFAA